MSVSFMGAQAQSLAPVQTPDAERGRALLLNHQESGCVLCHRIPGLASRAELGPDLSGVASRFTDEALFDQIADARRVNPHTIMPPTLSRDGLHRVASAWKDKTLLRAEQVRDIVAYLRLVSSGVAANPIDGGKP